MKTPIKTMVRCAAFLSGLAVLLLLTSKILVPKNNAKENGMLDPSANGILGEPEQTIDVLFLGDSECYSAFIPLRLWEKHGITSYNCGTALQNLYYTEEFLEKAFQKQSPKVVVLETNAIFRDFSVGASAVHKFKQWFPVFQYHDLWKRLKPGEVHLSDAVFTHKEDAKGYIWDNKVAPASPNDYMAPTQEIQSVSVRNYAYVKDFRDFCEKHGAKLILVSTPSTVNWNMKRHNGIQKLAEELELHYFDLNEPKSPVKIDWAKDTRDKGDHMNYAGACKVTDWLGKHLIETGLVKSRRNDGLCKEWNAAAERFNSKRL